MTTKGMIQKAAEAVRSLQSIPDEMVSQILRETASRLREAEDLILVANARDLSRMSPDNPKYDRLKLTPERIDGIASDMENVAGLPSPLGKVISGTVRPDGMTIRKVSVPFGVIGVIYEARPNVTADVFSLCFRSGNVCVLKGGSDAGSSSSTIVSLIQIRRYVHCSQLPARRQQNFSGLSVLSI